LMASVCVTTASASNNESILNPHLFICLT
jgi:hypothetical protein